MISVPTQSLASPSLCPQTTTSCHHIHILLLFPAPLPLHSGSVCNPFIVTEVLALKMCECKLKERVAFAGVPTLVMKLLYRSCFARTLHFRDFHFVG